MMRSLALALSAVALLEGSQASITDVLERRSQRLRTSSQRAEAQAMPRVARMDTSDWGEPTNAPLFGDADEVARYIEKRRQVDLAFEGTKPDVDIPPDEERNIRAAFEETPDVFKHCILIRDFATPLRVGSALNLDHVGHRHLRRSTTKIPKNETEDEDDQEGESSTHPLSTSSKEPGMWEWPTLAPTQTGWPTLAPTQSPGWPPKNPFLNQSMDTAMSPAPDDGPIVNAHAPPIKTLTSSGGVVDRDEAPDGVVDQALMEVNMIAYLQAIAGHVSVVPRGDVAKWNSKRKVPIAGYLCTDNGDPVLHTLPTPCVATALTEDGTEMMPPPPPAGLPPLGMSPRGGDESDVLPMSPRMPSWGMEPSSAPAPAANDAWAPSPSEAFNFMQHSAHHGRHRHNGHHHHGHHHGHARAPAPADPNAMFAVYIGSLKLHFSSVKKAAGFCLDLTRKIAEDPGDNEWDTEKLKGMVLGTDIKMSTFVQLAQRDPPQAWTTGKKKVLVIIADWMPGDTSRAPMTKQTLTPFHVRETIFSRVKKAFQDMSGGRFDIDYDVVPEVVPFTKPRSRFVGAGYPFPGLYHAAVEALAGNAKYGNAYKVDNYDLVYTLTPQQAPVGTKGVAWMGAKGAMCNGCEAVSENMQVMVAVHELGHNLGLSHASSNSLEYGNPFDWMGNYPDVQGLSYGMGYKSKLGWLPQGSVRQLTDNDVAKLNDRYMISAFDLANHKNGQILGLQIQLAKNPRDIFISFRKTAGKNMGVYVVYQDREKAQSELVDMACHSPSQADARLQPGWTYVEPSSQIVVHVESVSDEFATVHLFRAPGGNDLKSIRARQKYSDGKYKCPRTCADADLLVASVDSCPNLAKQGFCKGGSINMGGKKLSIGTDLCPESCNTCDQVLAGPVMVGAAGCADTSTKINGMSCPLVASRGHCEATTTIGHVGRDLCPKSCGHCPPVPVFAQTSAGAGNYANPTPQRTHGDGAAEPAAAVTTTTTAPEDGPTEDAPPARTPGQSSAECHDVDEWKDSEGDGCRVYAKSIAQGRMSQSQACNYGDGVANEYCRKTCGQCGAVCQDDPHWKDQDGDTCKVYADFIKNGQITKRTACSYGGGDSARHCKITCGTCTNQPTASSLDTNECEDAPCVSEWLKKTGQCFICKDWPVRCNEPGFLRDCPRTCGKCKSSATAVEKEEDNDEDDEGASTTWHIKQLLPPVKEADDDDDAPVPCEDDECIEHWREKSGGKCLKCKDYGTQFCGNDREYMEACPLTCKLCLPGQEPQKCHDIFPRRKCTEYKSMDWCSHKDISENCMQTCGLCADGMEIDDYPYDQPDFEKEEVTTTVLFKAAAPRGPGACWPLLAVLAAVFSACS